ncbi:MAG: SusE domain-containing protein, partial [Bacteroidales bacterium]|nr:SusE domain-containing protein [Bacteroidales bacterium]
MKTRTLFLFTAFAACTFCACSDDSTQDITGEIPEIKLTAPENGVTFDLQGKKGITFQWEKAKGISVYKLALSLSEDMSNPKTIKITGSTDVLNAYQLDLDARITALGIEDFTEGARIYWTIRPANDAVKAQSEVRYFTAYRLPVVIPGRPSGGEYVDANEFTDNKYPFSWVKIENANAYTLKISTSRNFPENDTYTEEVGDTDHFDFTSAAAETFFANMGLQPDQLNHITFYWTVLPNPASERYTAAVDSFYAIRKGAGATE